MITLLYASILGLLSVLLANQVLYVRLRGGKEEKWRSNATERVQANFVENVPLALIILFIFEYSSSSNNLIHIFGILLILFRFLRLIIISDLFFLGTEPPTKLVLPPCGIIDIFCNEHSFTTLDKFLIDFGKTIFTIFIDFRLFSRRDFRNLGL